MLERSLVAVLTPAVAKAIVPMATVHAELELGADTSQDAKITRLIGVATAEFAGMNGLQRPLFRQTYLERTRLHDNRDPWNGSVLGLTRWPIESVTSVTDAGEDSETVDASDYSIALEHRSGLYRELRWSKCWDYLVTYIAGWVPPGSGPGLVTSWVANTAILAGAFAKPAAAAQASNPLLFECTTAGTTAAVTEPTWPVVVGGTVTDGTVTWTARPAIELPANIQEAAIVTVKQWLNGGLDIPAGIQMEAGGGHTIAYDFVAARAGMSLPPYALKVLGSYR
jgi:hypothetical protein